jgi:hypothetical protein
VNARIFSRFIFMMSSIPIASLEYPDHPHNLNSIGILDHGKGKMIYIPVITGRARGRNSLEARKQKE